MTKRLDRALITGGCGFVGSHLAEHLSRQGTEIICVDNLATGDRAHAIGEFVEHDVTEPLPRLPHCDAVFHLASAASPRDYFRLPIETLRAGSLGTAHALDFARAHGARFVLASTSEVYGDPLEHPQRESYWGNVNPIGPRSVYDEAKRYAEALTSAYRREHGTDTAIARIFNTYGPRMRPGDGRLIPTLIGQALAGEPLTVHGDGLQTRSLCYVDDTVRGLIALALSGHAGPVNLGNPDEYTVLEIAERVREVTGSDSPVEHGEPDTDDPRRRCPDIGLARQALGWWPETPLEKGLGQTVEWFARTGEPLR
ncbi:dTDP-glucose 4,6-dehydratase [Amycolatopsis xylanica]|uniref:dTDP-glucose 4,6-dehydratase n=1 Tax=Amycolatopsis xylanica TaxID=589385 RepID=A0A1H3SCA9_9PSEU|nr:NAD-dependent epimerase/dehydratase family protein [Amycolatopsis xylanica]SDZ34759.1 dTDP-glucose 4,6-dehydratase [Amycolatopsis xylanica]